MVSRIHWNEFYSWNHEEWIVNNVTKKLGKEKEALWSILFALALDTLWYTRNQFVFEGSLSLGFDLISRIQARVKEISYVFESPLSILSSSPGCSLIKVKWNPPPEGWFKLNSDGSVRSGLSQAACGGLLRSMHGNFIGGVLL